eukprot:1650188-Rhodomonas_salina.1
MVRQDGLVASAEFIGAVSKVRPMLCMKLIGALNKVRHMLCMKYVGVVVGFIGTLSEVGENYGACYGLYKFIGAARKMRPCALYQLIVAVST